MPPPPHRVRVPCTLDMINHIININTTTNSTMHNLMLATGVSLAYHLCLMSSEYVTRTVVPIDDSHQFRTTEVELMLNDGSFTLLASNKLHCSYSAIKLVKFSMLHAKNMACQSGFLQQIRIISPYLSFNCCTVGQQLHCVTIQTRSCHFCLIEFSIVYYTRTFNRLSNRPPNISIWMKLGSIRSLYGCQSPRLHEQHENRQRWVVGKQYRPQ